MFFFLPSSWKGSHFVDVCTGSMIGMVLSLSIWTFVLRFDRTRLQSFMADAFFYRIVNVNVTDSVSWQGHHDRVMQLNWLYFCGICQMISMKMRPNTVLGFNHQSICMPQLQPSCSASLGPMYYPGGMKARVLRRVSPVLWSKPYSILAPTQDSTRAAGFKS